MIPTIFLPSLPPSLPQDREVQRILLELLNQMDGFDQSTNVKVRPPSLPPSLPSCFVRPVPLSQTLPPSLPPSLPPFLPPFLPS